MPRSNYPSKAACKRESEFVTESVSENRFLRKKVRPLNFLVFLLLSVILIGSVLLWLPISHKTGAAVSYANALFTATSASTVTGLVVVDTLSTFNLFGQLIILILINFGGLGYMTVITFFFLSNKSWSMSYAVFAKESLNLPSIGELLKVARKVFAVIIVFELIGIALLTFVWLKDFSFWTSLWYGIFHAMSAFNNAGFDLMGGFKSFTSYHSNVLLNLTIMALIFFGGLGFMVISDILPFKRIRNRLSLHTKIVLSTSIILILLGAFGFYALEKNHAFTEYSESDKWLVSLFQSVTARTAGFNTIDISILSLPTLLLLCFLMFIGASPGSTGSGIKTSTFAVLVLWLISVLKNKDNPEAFGRSISKETIEKAVFLFLSSIASIFVIIFLISLVEAFPLEKIVFEVVSAFGTVGLSTGITPALTVFSKYLLCIMMFVGRMTPLSLIYLLSRKNRSEVKLVEDDVSIG